jgi:hypothetical protein
MQGETVGTILRNKINCWNAVVSVLYVQEHLLQKLWNVTLMGMMGFCISNVEEAVHKQKDAGVDGVIADHVMEIAKAVRQLELHPMSSS